MGAKVIQQHTGSLPYKSAEHTYLSKAKALRNRDEVSETKLGAWHLSPSEELFWTGANCWNVDLVSIIQKFYKIGDLVGYDFKVPDPYSFILKYRVYIWAMGHWS